MSKNNSVFTIFLLVFLILYSGCGFTPIYKQSDYEIDFGSYKVAIENESAVSRAVIEKIRETFTSSGEQRYKVSMSISETEVPLIINSNGTISKYRIEIFIDYFLINLITDEQIKEDSVRGYAQYDVQESEIANMETKDSMLKSATNEALQIMLSKIQGNLSRNDN